MDTEHQPSILIVDADEGARQTWTLILREQGYATDAAGSGQKALAQARERCFDLALLDIRLPDRGVPLIAPLKALHPDMAVLIVTDYASQKTAGEALNEGAAGYLTEPLEMDEALAKIRNVLERQRLTLENRRLDREMRQEIAERRQAEAALQESVQELRAHMQELAVTEEELRQQNEELAAVQHAVEAGRRRYQALFEFAPDGYLVTDTRGTIQEANRAAASLLNVSQDSLVGKPLGLFVPQEGRNAFDARLGHSSAELVDSQAWDATLQPRDAAACPVAITVAPARDPQGKPVGLRWLIRDITERKRAEEALAQERNLLRTLIDNLPDAIYVKDRESRFLLKNLADTRRMGAASPDETIGKTDFDYYPPGLAAQYYDDDQAVIHSGQAIVNREEPVIEATGRSGWVSTTKVPLRNPQGQVIGLVGIGHDITEHKRAEESLRVTSSILRSLNAAANVVEAFPTVVAGLKAVTGCERLSLLLLDPAGEAGTFIALNGPRPELSQGSRLKLSDTAATADVLAGRPHLTPDLTSEAQWPGEQALFQAGYRSRLNLPLHVGARVIGALSLAWRQPAGYDITQLPLLTQISDALALAVEKSRLLEETRRLATFNESLVTGMAEGLLLEDRKGYITFVNPMLATLLHAPAEALLGRHWTEFVPSEYHDAIGREMARRPRGETSHYETALLRSDGQHIPVLVSAALLFQEGHFTGVLATVTDITERKQAEEEIRTLNTELEQRVAARTAELTQREAALRAANEKLKELDRLKSQFISNVSHELRTPLTNIITSLYLIERKPEKHDYYMTTMRHESDLLKRLIEDLLQLSRIDMGKVALVLRPVDINTQVESLVADRSALFAERGLNLVAQTAPDLPLVQADPNMLIQVLTNLMTNAMNYTPAGGTVTVRTGLEIADCRLPIADLPSATPETVGNAVSNLQPPTSNLKSQISNQQWVTLSVADTGPGITPEDRAHLFERFFRGEAARQSGASGTGLGLAICQEIIHRHGGRITVASQAGQGSTFTMWLPATSQGKIAAAPAPTGVPITRPA